MSASEWDDGRLDRAFADRYGKPAPPDLVDAVMASMAHQKPARRLRGVRLAWLSAAAAAIVVASAVALRAPVEPPATTRQPPTTAPSSTPSRGTQSHLPASSPSRGGDLPLFVVGELRAITVSEALALRDAGPDDTEIAVRGWEPPIPPIRCPFPAAASPIERQCDDAGILTEVRQRLVRQDGSSLRTLDPSGPSLPLVFPIPGPRPSSLSPPLHGRPTGMSPSPDAEATPDTAHGEPVEVVLIGHFADYRSDLCSDPTACRREFVVDERVRLDGQADERPWDYSRRQSEARLEPTTARAAVEVLTRTETHLGVALLDAPSIVDVDPRVAEASNLRDAALVWVVRQLEDRDGEPVARTYLVDDASSAVFRSEAAGVTEVGAPPLTVPLSERVAAVIRDETGMLADARPLGASATIADDHRFGEDGMIAADLAQPSPDTLWLRWDGSMCDSTWLLVIEDEGPTIVLDHPPIDGCALVPVPVALELTFHEPFDLSRVAVTVDSPYHPWSPSR